MKVLTIGSDKELLQKGSVSHVRHQAYATHVVALHTVVFAGQQHGTEPVAIAENAWAHPTGSSSKPRLLVDAYRIGRRLLREHGEWVIVTQDPFEAGFVGYLLSRATHTPLLMHEHGDFFSQPYWRKESIMNFLRYLCGLFIVRTATHLRPVSTRIRDTLHRLGVPEERMSVSHVYTDVSAFSRATPEPDIAALRPDGGVLILTMGRFVPQKNLPMLVRAFVRARNDGMNARLVLIGSGPLERKLKALASEAPDGSIVFKEWTDNPAGAMRAADIFALSSNYEGWGRVCIEALAAGTTLLMTDTGCAGEVVEDGENGLVVPVGDEWSFMHGLTLLAGDTDLRARLSSGGKETVQTLPTFDENVALYIASIRACLKRANNNGTRSPKS